MCLPVIPCNLTSDISKEHIRLALGVIVNFMARQLEALKKTTVSFLRVETL